ncbi:MAG: TIGR03013 family PEP-CTERM/XrtA system glycosyltransferase, partial [Desulfuromonadales bacterium]|nr:TIGR03013 family PEP-CTERM/XrtA system glycosyltransferase [Desulfuromonadales bacterium]
FAGFIRLEGEGGTVAAERLVGDLGTLVETARRLRVSKIVVALTERRGVLPVREVLRCRLAGIRVMDAVSFYEQVTGKLMIENINPSWFIFSDGFRLTPAMRVAKRGLDVVLALVGLVLALPLMLLTALAIKIDSPGPVLFRQVRTGEGERPFTLYKFRSMRQDAEQATGAVWAQTNDPRVTRLGRFMRKSRIDEIPQLINVIKGEMSFVGPRPERPEFVGRLTQKIPYYSNRHYVKPGVTGWAQIRYPYGASEEDALEKLRYDLYYTKNYSLGLDLAIIASTFRVVLFGRGGR